MYKMFEVYDKHWIFDKTIHKYEVQYSQIIC